MTQGVDVAVTSVPDICAAVMDLADEYERHSEKLFTGYQVQNFLREAANDLRRNAAQVQQGRRSK